MFDKPDSAAETFETLGGFLRGMGFVCYFLAVLCAAMAVWDGVVLAGIERFGSEWVHEFFRRPLWTMVIFALGFALNGVCFVRLGTWIKRRTVAPAAGPRSSASPAPPQA